MRILYSLFVITVLLPVFVLADVYSSSNFQVLDPVIDLGGGRSTSSSFDLLQSFGQYMLGTTTATNFNMQSGFLTYPVASSPVLSATAGAESVDLAWTASQAFVGWSVSGYDLGVSTASGGPYDYEDVGNVLTYTKSGLTGGTTYYFRIKVKDAFGNQIALSNEASAVPTSAEAPPGGGGGPLQPSIPPEQVVFSGKAYPLSTVILLKDAQIVTSVFADANGDFRVSSGGYTAGNYLFSIYARDIVGRSSRLLTFPTIIKGDEVVVISGIFIPPTIEANKIEVRFGDNIVFSGQTAPRTDVVLVVSPPDLYSKIVSDVNGNYVYNIDTSRLDYGPHGARTKALIDDISTIFGYAVEFEVGDENILVEPDGRPCPSYGDFNNDCRVNIVDFSILMYWFFRVDFPDVVDTNNDEIIDIYDFSVMAYYWTG
jgi:hypothetical protein